MLSLRLIRSCHEGDTSKKEEGADAIAEDLLGLKVLNLAFQSIGTIGDALDPFSNCRELYLEHNAIEEIEGLDFLTNLILLSLGSNRISRVRNLSSCTKLRFLDLSDNLVQSCDGDALPLSLQTLDMRGNPCAAANVAAGERYRKSIVSSLPDLRIFDGERIKDNQDSVQEGRQLSLRVTLQDCPRTRIVDLDFAVDDDFVAVAEQFCRDHDLSANDSVRVLVAQMEAVALGGPPSRCYGVSEGKHGEVVEEEDDGVEEGKESEAAAETGKENDVGGGHEDHKKIMRQQQEQNTSLLEKAMVLLDEDGQEALSSVRERVARTQSDAQRRARQAIEQSRMRREARMREVEEGAAAREAKHRAVKEQSDQFAESVRKRLVENKIN